MEKNLELVKKVFLKKFEKIVENFCQKLHDYTSNPNDENIHDIRVSIRRLESAYQILPKNVRRQERIREYVKYAKKLFKINAKIRDYDIICANMELHHSNKTKNLVSALKSSRSEQIKDASKLALEISCLGIPKITKSSIKKSKLTKRYLKILDGTILDIHKNSIIALGDEKRINELHTLRKNFKKLRYTLELASDKKTTQDILQNLKNIQDILGEIHDSDIIIDYLKSVDHDSKYSDIISAEVLRRSKKYNAFVLAFKKNPEAINFEL